MKKGFITSVPDLVWLVVFMVYIHVLTKDKVLDIANTRYYEYRKRHFNITNFVFILKSLSYYFFVYVSLVQLRLSHLDYTKNSKFLTSSLYRL